MEAPERPIDALFAVVAVAALCMLAVLAVVQAVGTPHNDKRPCSFTKIEGFSKVK